MDRRLIFASAVAVCARHDVVSGIPHVTQLVSDYIAVSTRWTLQLASESGYPRLILLLIARRAPLLDSRLVADVCNIGVNRAVESNRLHVLVAFDRCFPSLVMTHAASLAVAHGRLHILRWLFERRALVCWGNDVFTEAARAGRLSVLRRVYSWFQVAPSIHAISETIRGGHDAASEWLWLLLVNTEDLPSQAVALSLAPLRLAKWMVGHAIRPCSILLDDAARRGDLAFIHWAENLRRSTATTAAMDGAAGSGFLFVVKYLHFYRREGCTHAAIDGAARGGHLRVARWMFSHRSEGCSAAAYLSAVARGDLAMLELLLEHCPAVCPAFIGDHAAAHGQLAVVRFLHERGVGSFTARAIDWAAAGNHLDVVVWLHENRGEGCTVGAVDGAAANGHLNMIMWLDAMRDEGGSVRAILDASAGGHLDVVMYLWRHLAHECTIVAVANAIRSGNIPLAMWIYDRVEGPSDSPMAAMDAAVSTGSMVMIRWLCKRERPGCTSRAVDDAIEAGYLQVVAYVFRKFGVTCSPGAFHRAVASNRLFAAGWASSHAHFPVELADYQAYFDRHGWSLSVRGAVGLPV